MTDKAFSQTCTLKTAYKKYDKRNILIKTSEVIVINRVTSGYVMMITSNSRKRIKKTTYETNADNAISVRTYGTSRFRKSVGHARKSVWWMPWH